MKACKTPAKAVMKLEAIDDGYRIVWTKNVRGAAKRWISLCFSDMIKGYETKWNDRGLEWMGVFRFFKKNKAEPTDEQKKWNKMWELWAENRADTPYAEVMTYQSEVNNGGHDQYFFNVEQMGDLQAEISILKNVLSEKLRSNLLTAYDAYQMLADKESDEEWEAILERCDNVFFKNEEEINRILKEYASKIEL